MWERVLGFGGFVVNWAKSGAQVLWGSREEMKKYRKDVDKKRKGQQERQE